MKNIAVEGCTLSLSSGTGQVSITTTPSSKVLLDGKKAYFGNLQISISAFTSPTITVSSSGSGSGTLSPTSQKVKSENNAAVLEGDKAQITVTGQAISGTTTVVVTEIVTVTISSAGQEKVKGE